MARPEGGISVTSHQSLVTGHSRLRIPSYQSLVLLIPASKLQGTPHERTLFS